MTHGTLARALELIDDFDDSDVELEYLRTIANSDLIWLKVTGVKTISPPEPYVYDLTVENSHNFVANGLVVHNSGSVMFGQITSGKPATVTTSTGNGEIVRAEIMIDVLKAAGGAPASRSRPRRWPTCAPDTDRSTIFV